MSRIKKIILGIVFLLMTGAAYFFFLKNKEVQEFTIEFAEVMKGDISSVITATGTIEPITQVDVGTQVSAEVKKIYVDFNSKVKKGQLIAELDKTNLKTAVIEAEANYNKAINEKEYLEKFFNRQKDLFKNQLISDAAFDESKYNFDNIKETVTQRYSDLSKAKTNLSYANIYSPIDGVVLSKDVDEGQTVAASFSSPTLFTIAQDLKEMQVEADVDEADIGEVKIGQRVTFTVDAFPEDQFGGVVTQVRLNPTVNSNVVTYIVIIKANNNEMKLMPGLTATITIYTYENKDILTLKGSALNFQPNKELLRAYNNKSIPKDGRSRKQKSERDQNKEVVWVLEDSAIKPKEIKSGMSDGVNIEIIEGLSLGDKVIYHFSEKEVVKTKRGGGGSPFMPTRGGKK